MKELGVDDEETLVISKELDEESKNDEKNHIFNQELSESKNFDSNVETGLFNLA